MGLSYEAPPSKIISLLHSVLQAHPDVIPATQPQVFVDAFSDSSIIYKLKFFVADYMARSAIKSAVFSSAWYAVHRAGYSFPFPVVDIRTTSSAEQKESMIEKTLRDDSFDILRNELLFASLSDSAIKDIVEHDPIIVFGDAETIVRQGDVGGSMYVVLEGICSVQVQSTSASKKRIELAELGKGDVFGEMASLTDEPRKASILANGHVMLQEISQRMINDQFLRNADAMEAFAAVMAEREAARRQFTSDQAKTYQFDLANRMRQAFARLFSAG